MEDEEGTPRVALVTGGGTGIGLGAARELVRAGFHVVIVGRRQEVLDEAVQQLQCLGEASSVQADVGGLDHPAWVVDEVVTRHGRLDCLVTAAGVFEEASILEMTHEQWDTMMNVNLRGTWLCAQAAARHMVAQGHGRMVLIGSIAANQAEGKNAAHYCVSKAGVHALTQTLGTVLAAEGVQVNAIAPGLVETPLTAAMVADLDSANVATVLPTAQVCQATRWACSCASWPPTLPYPWSPPWSPWTAGKRPR